jgi:hypothetical protein
MTYQMYLNSLELSPDNGIYINKAPTYRPGTKYDSSSAWRGTKVRINGIQSSPVKITLQGHCSTDAALRSLVKYDASVYDWNLDSEDLYYITDLRKRWKIYSMEVQADFDKDDSPFTITMITDKMAGEGFVQNAKIGTASSSPTNVTGFLNAGDQDTYFESIKITGVYYGGLNCTSVKITQDLVAYVLNVADVLLDTAYMVFYDDYVVNHLYVDPFASATLFNRNKNSSTAATFDYDHIDIGNSGEVKYRFRLTHALSMDPELTLSISNLIGTPKLEVSQDGTVWWEVEKVLANGALTKYNLTKLAGASDFYFRITTGATSSLTLSYMKVDSWHRYSGQRPIPYLRANSVSDDMEITFSGGHCTYDFRYRDRWSV